MTSNEPWLPIESAPRDGTYVLLRFPGPFNDSECPGAAVGKAIDREPGWWLTGIWAATTAHHAPDAWAPLPNTRHTPPAADAVEAAKRYLEPLADMFVSGFGRDMPRAELMSEVERVVRRAITAISAYERCSGVERLREAANGVLRYRVGDLPTQGWLRDNDASRAALAALASALSSLKESDR